MTTWILRTVHTWHTDDGRLTFAINDGYWVASASHIADAAALIAGGLDKPTSSLRQLIVDCRKMMGSSSNLLKPTAVSYDIGDTGIRLSSDGAGKPWTVAWMSGDDAVFAQTACALYDRSYLSCDAALAAVRSTFHDLAHPVTADTTI